MLDFNIQQAAMYCNECSKRHRIEINQCIKLKTVFIRVRSCTSSLTPKLYKSLFRTKVSH